MKLAAHESKAAASPSSRAARLSRASRKRCKSCVRARLCVHMEVHITVATSRQDENHSGGGGGGGGGGAAETWASSFARSRVESVRKLVFRGRLWRHSKHSAVNGKSTPLARSRETSLLQKPNVIPSGTAGNLGFPVTINNGAL